ncbi:MAG: 6-phosphogluconolactonase [Legionella sp.]|nr:6-phosphogluconolactonase [Legionella sp.]
MQLHSFSDVATLNDYFAEQLASILRKAIACRGHAYLVVSGGKTPQSLFAMLAKQELDWQKVTITLADERWLAPCEADSNERLVRANLLQHRAAKATFISLYREATDPFANLTLLDDELSALPTFDAVILGMGEDGHTASLFPCSSEITSGLADSPASVLVVTPATAPYQRISLTKTRLLNSRAIYLHLVGEKKLPILNKALEASEPATALPVRAFLHHPTANVHVMFAPL